MDHAVQGRLHGGQATTLTLRQTCESSTTRHGQFSSPGKSSITSQPSVRFSVQRHTVALFGALNVHVQIDCVVGFINKLCFVTLSFSVVDI